MEAACKKTKKRQKEAYLQACAPPLFIVSLHVAHSPQALQTQTLIQAKPKN